MLTLRVPGMKKSKNLNRSILCYIIKISFERVNHGGYKYKKLSINVIKLRNDGFEGNTKNVLLFFFENLNFLLTYR